MVHRYFRTKKSWLKVLEINQKGWRTNEFENMGFVKRGELEVKNICLILN